MNGVDRAPYILQDTIYAGAGNDIIKGGKGNDILFGESGDDQYFVGDGVDYIFDVSGNDQIIFDSSYDPTKFTYSPSIDNYYLDVFYNGIQKVRLYDQFSGWGSGVEQLVVSGKTTINFSSVVFDQIGDDTNNYMVGISFNAAPNTRIFGNGGNDFIYGSPGDDYMDGGTGGDLLSGYLGNDTIYGGVGDDYIDGGDDNDRIFAGVGNDTANGGIGNDVIDAGDGNDLVYEGLGNDIIDGGLGIDTLSYELATGGVLISLTTLSAQSTGGAGNDTIKNFENLIGSNYVDQLKGNASNNVISGMAGNDIIDGGLGDDILDGGAGYDTLYFGLASSGVTVDLSITAAQDTKGSGIDTISGFECVTGSGYGDTIIGNSGSNSIRGGAGDDIINGRAGGDTLRGETGSDTFVFDASSLGASDTLMDFSLVENDKIDLRSLLLGYNSLTSSIADFVQITTSGANSIVKVDVDGGADSFAQIATIMTLTGLTASSLVLSGNLIVPQTVAVPITGTSGNDILNGTNGDDTINGLVGNDTINAGSGNDIVDGGAGNDIMDGGAGNDTLTYQSTTGGVVANLATTTIQSTSGSGYDTIKNFENLIGSNSVDQLKGDSNSNKIWGMAGNDIIDGGLGDDILDGGAGYDTVKGGDGNDNINGGAGNDSLYGDNGNDLIYGDDGLDTLWGGGGSDIFVFTGATAFKNIDVIADFKTSELDKINIKDLLQGYDPLTKAITDFVQITTSGSNSILKVDYDGGGNNFVQIATLNNITGLTDEQVLVSSGRLVVV